MRAGEYVRNLRSALDRMVWQLAAVRGQCAGRRGGGSECPGRHNRFPVGKPTAGRRLAKQPCESDDVARGYITAVRPCRQTDNHCRADLRQDSLGLDLLGYICNPGRHRLLLTATVLWPGTHEPGQLRFSRYRSRRTPLAQTAWSPGARR